MELSVYEQFAKLEEGHFWFQGRRTIFFDLIERAFSESGTSPNGRQAERQILEVGCGPGTFAETIPNRDLTCLDPIPAMLAVAEKRVNANRENPAKFVEATAEDMPFEDAVFDGVCSLFSFRDWFDKRAGLAEVNRVLKPGGTLVIVDPAKMNRVHGWLGYLWMRVWVGAYARFICRMKDHPWKWLTKTYVHFGTTKTYVRMLKECGFTDVKAKVIFPGMATIWTARRPGES